MKLGMKLHGLLLSYLLVLPEVSLDGDGDSVVLQLAGVKELL